MKQEEAKVGMRVCFGGNEGTIIDNTSLDYGCYVRFDGDRYEPGYEIFMEYEQIEKL